MLSHRGPDDEGAYLDPRRRISLAARRLSIIDVAAGHQPLANEDGDIWAVLNGEIYNHPELIELLRGHGHRFSTRSDTEVLVHLYEHFGEALVHALEGMFAFAIWDERRGRLLLARDRFGEKPLYLRQTGGELEFASEVAPLAAVADRADVRPAGIDAFFVFGYVPGPETAVEGVRQLPPGHLLVHDVATRTSELRRYWAPPRRSAPAVELKAELEAETRHLLERALRRTLVSDVPVGALISGGVDSTLSAALLTELVDRPPRTYTVGYDTGTVSELETARRTAAVLGTDHHEVVLTEAAVAESAPRLLAAVDQPIADPALIAVHAVCGLARRDVKVVIGGQGADELFGGYPRYRWLRRSLTVERVVPAPAAALGARAVTALFGERRLGRLAHVLAPQPTVERQLSWVGGRRAELRGRLYGPRLRELHAGDGPLESLLARIEGAGDPGAGALMRLDQTHWLPDDVLMMNDRAGMLVGLEVRTPFLDRELAEFATTVAPEVHLGRSGKQLLRAALATLAPVELTQRRKRAFRTPIAEWLRGPLQASAREHLLEGSLSTDGWFEREAMLALLDGHANGDDHSTVLWPLMALGCWLDGR